MDSATAIKQRAQALIQRGAYQEAMAEYARLAGEDRVDPGVYILMGDLCLRMGQRAEAVGRYREAAGAYDQLGLLRNAIGVFKKILRVDPQRPGPHRRLADLYARKGLLADSVRHELEHASLSIQAGDAQSAREALARASQTGAPGARLGMRLADLLVALGEPERAVHELHTLAHRLDREGRSDQVQALLERARQLAPQTSLTEARQPQGETVPPGPAGGLSAPIDEAGGAALAAPGTAAPGAEAGSAPALRESDPIGQEDTEPQSHQVVAEETSQDLEKTDAVIESHDGEAGCSVPPEFPALEQAAEPGAGAAAAEAGGGGDGPASSVAGRSAAPAGEIDAHDAAAETSCPRTVPSSDRDQIERILARFREDVGSQLEGEDHAAHYDLALAYVEMGLEREAIAELEVAQAGSEHRRRCLELLASCYSRLGEPFRAAGYLRAALEELDPLDRHDADLRVQLGTALMEAGEFDEARSVLRRVVDRDPSHSAARGRLEALGG